MEILKEYETEGIRYFVKTSNRRTAAIEVTRNGKVLVRAPLSLKISDIPNIIVKNKAWILKSIEKQKSLPNNFELTEEEKCNLKEKAQQVILPLVKKYSSIMELYPTSIKINFAKTRFGSCSLKDRINFSAYLMNYKIEAVEYVVVHELAHIKYHNHSKEFYLLIEKYMPDYKERIKMLKI